MLGVELVAEIRQRASRGQSIRAIGRAMQLARGTVRRYLRSPVTPGWQVRPNARRLSDSHRAVVRDLIDGAGGNASEVYRRLYVDRVSVSLRTVQRVVVPFRTCDSISSKPAEPWELPLVRSIARRYGRHDADELESFLVMRLEILRHRNRDTAINWRAFVTTALTRRAFSWLKERRREREGMVSLDERVNDPTDRTTPNGLLSVNRGAEEAEYDTERLMEALPAPHRRVVRVLLQERFDQLRTARRLGIHRNTLARRLRHIRSILAQRGCGSE